MKKWLLGLLCIINFGYAQERTLPYYVAQAKANIPELQLNANLQEIGTIQAAVIKAQNNAFQVFASSDIWFAPYFNNNGKPVDLTIDPSNKAIGYDVAVTNGGLYSAQLNVTKSLFNKALVDRLLFQNEVQNNSIALNSELIAHTLEKTITDAYIAAYQLQEAKGYAKTLVQDLQLRLEVVAELVKEGVLQQSDYAVLELEVQNRQLELQQLDASLATAIHQLDTSCYLPFTAITVLAPPNVVPIETSQDDFYYRRKYATDSLQLAADKAVFENKYKPSLNLYGNTGLNAVTLSGIQRKFGVSAGLQLNIPIYDGKQRALNATQTRLKMDNLKLQKQAASLQLTNQLQDIEQQLSNLEVSKQLLVKQLQQQEKILDIYKGKLVQGQVSVIEYLNVLQSYKLRVQTQVQMQTNYWLLQSQYQYINW